MALPVIDAAGQEFYERTMLPLSLCLSERCDSPFLVSRFTTTGAKVSKSPGVGFAQKVVSVRVKRTNDNSPAVHCWDQRV